MKLIYFIPFVVIIGVVVLFFFPEPETNYVWYVLTAAIFLAIIIFLLYGQNSNRFKNN